MNVLPAILFIFTTVFCLPGFAKDVEVELSQKIMATSGDKIKLKSSIFSLQVEADPGTECAVPGRNCGSGYIPPHPKIKIDCGEKSPCPFIVMSEIKDANSVSLSIESEESCEKNNPERCFYEFAIIFKNDDGCQKLKGPMARYYCLERFSESRKIENKDLCDKLPAEIFALRWNCYYDYAIRYRDPLFCEKYGPKDLSGKDRCLLKMAELLKDKKYCQKISASKEHTYMEQCLNLTMPQN